MNKITLFGEKIISSNADVEKMLIHKDSKTLFEMAEEQISAGASVIDINTALLMKDELNAMLWAVRLLIEKFDVKISIDSPDSGVLERCIKEFGNRVIANSLPADTEVLGRMLAIISEYQSGVVIILKNRSGIPEDSKGRLKLAGRAVNLIEEAGIPPEDVYLDPIITTIGTDTNGGGLVLDCFAKLEESYPAYQRLGGLSNISFGLPLRKLLNRTFLSMAIARGMNAVICDPTDRKLLETLRAAEAIAGADPGCRDFLAYYRNINK